MSYEFQSILFPTAREMCDEIAYEWMTAGGSNNSADIDQLLAETLPEGHVAECMDGWGFFRIDGESGDTWMEKRGVDREALLAAFLRFAKNRPDRNRTYED